MNTKKTTPPYIFNSRKVIFDYDEEKFFKTIAKIGSELFSCIRVSVWAENQEGQLSNILESELSGEEFDILCQNATYTIYEGHPKDLATIGIV